MLWAVLTSTTKTSTNRVSPHRSSHNMLLTVLLHLVFRGCGGKCGLLAGSPRSLDLMEACPRGTNTSFAHMEQ